MKEDFVKGIVKENPTFVLILGMCPVLAVTNSVINGVAIGLATLAVVTASNAIISMVRKWIPKEVRIASYILIIAALVTAAEYVIQAVSLDVHKSLGAFLALIVVNCIILGRAEAFASRNGVIPSVLDGLGFGVGFTLACVAISTVREVLGNGTFAGMTVFGPRFEPWTIMILPGGAFFVVGSYLLLFNWTKRRKA